ncbi:MAG: hypothetical protein HYV07_23200 [Deltaproteobacteria bacterium]|nr:hypothetical protein [Deltaproteobacteria bacterium]
MKLGACDAGQARRRALARVLRAQRLLAAFAAVALAACPGADPARPDPEAPNDRVPIELEERPFEQLPIVDGERVVFAGDVSGTRVKIVHDDTLRDAITAKGACLDVLVRCLEAAPSGEATVKNCVSEAPVCATERPWDEAACCPAACKDAFFAERALDAYDSWILHFADGSECYPGLAALVGGGR